MFTMTDFFPRNCNNWDITDITVAICKNNKNNNTVLILLFMDLIDSIDASDQPPYYYAAVVHYQNKI